MTVRIEITGDDAWEALANLQGLSDNLRPAETGLDRRARAYAAIASDAAGAVGPILDKAAEAAVEPEPEQPKRTRGRPKKSDLPADVVAEAKAAGVNVSDQPGGADVVAEQQAVTKEPENEAEAPENKAEEVVTLTEQDVRNAIIDVLNAVVQKHEDDPDIRVKTLKPLLDSVGAEKISLIKPERYADVMAKLAEIKAKEGIE